MTYKHKQVLKLVVLTDEDIMTMNFEEQLNLVQEAIKDNRFHMEMINPGKKDGKDLD
jgi:hypothetical protein